MTPVIRGFFYHKKRLCQAVYFFGLCVRKTHQLEVLNFSYTTCSGNVCVSKPPHVEREILRKKSLLTFLQIRLIYTDQSASTSARAAEKWAEPQHHGEGEREALRRLEEGLPAPIDLSITRILLLFLALSCHH